MTAPAATSRPVESGPSVNATVNNSTAKPMTDTELRLECAKLAVALKPPSALVTSVARDLYRFVSGG